MSASTASVRARHLKSVLASLRRRPEAESGAVLRRIAPTLIQAIDDSAGVEWFPIEHDVALTHAIYEAFGPGEADRFWRRVMTEALATPLFRTLVEGALSLFGSMPAAWARWIPQGWELTFRDCGTWAVAQDEQGRSLLRSRCIPPDCAADPVWLAAVASSFSALVGKLEVRQVDAAAGTVELALGARKA
jgi:hypothetical protein